MQAYVAHLLAEQHREYSDSLAAEANKREALLKYVNRLEVASLPVCPARSSPQPDCMSCMII